MNKQNLVFGKKPMEENSFLSTWLVLLLLECMTYDAGLSKFTVLGHVWPQRSESRLPNHGRKIVEVIAVTTAHLP